MGLFHEQKVTNRALKLPSATLTAPQDTAQPTEIPQPRPPLSHYLECTLTTDTAGKPRSIHTPDHVTATIWHNITFLGLMLMLSSMEAICLYNLQRCVIHTFLLVCFNRSINSATVRLKRPTAYASKIRLTLVAAVRVW